MGRIVIARKAVLARLDDILNRYPSMDSYTGYIKLMRELQKFRDDLANDDPCLEPWFVECEKK